MKLYGKVTKTEVLLLAVAAVFLCVLTAMARHDRLAAEQAEILVVPERAAEEAAVPELLDLNTATEEELMELPGIGQVLARRIVDYRTEHGPFRSVEELMEVSGIGESRFGALQDSVTVKEQDGEGTE